MAGSRVNNYSPSTTDLTSLMSAVDAGRVGSMALSLTEYNSTGRPAIAGGSLVEVAGTLFRFSTEEPISTAGITSTAAGNWSIRLVPSSSQCSAQFSTAALAWREDLQGYYHSTTSNNRVVGTMYFNGADYITKKLLTTRDVFASTRNITAVYVQMESTVQISSVTFQVVGFTPTIDAGGDWSTVLNAFAPKSAGFYRINFELQMSTLSGVPYTQLATYIYKNGSTFKLCYHEVYHGSTTAGAIFNLQNELIDAAAPGDAYTFYAAETSYPSGGPVRKSAKYTVQAYRLI